MLHKASSKLALYNSTYPIIALVKVKKTLSLKQERQRADFLWWMPWAVRQEVSFLSLVFLFSSSGHSMSCCKRAYVADGCLQPISNLLDKCSVNLYNKYVGWLWQLWITGCLCFIFLFGSIFKAKDPSLFSSLLHHVFQPTQKQFHISGSILAAFFQYILIFSTNSELCILEYCCPLS